MKRLHFQVRHTASDFHSDFVLCLVLIIVRAGWSNVTGSVAYGGQGSLQYGGAVQFNPAQWMQLGPTVTAEVR